MSEIEKRDVRQPEVIAEEDALWVRDQNGNEPFWIDLRDPGGFYRATVRQDGCVHFYSRVGVDPTTEWEWDDEDVYYIHICDVDDTIKRLEALRDKARAFFGDPEWPH